MQLEYDEYTCFEKNKDDICLDLTPIGVFALDYFDL
jgi:hypothetical protein